jgi:hypothetical protein
MLRERVELYLYSPLGLDGLFWCEFYLFTKIVEQKQHEIYICVSKKLQTKNGRP